MYPKSTGLQQARPRSTAGKMPVTQQLPNDTCRQDFTSWITTTRALHQVHAYPDQYKGPTCNSNCTNQGSQLIPQLLPAVWSHTWGLAQRSNACSTSTIATSIRPIPNLKVWSGIQQHGLASHSQICMPLTCLSKPRDKQTCSRYCWWITHPIGD